MLDDCPARRREGGIKPVHLIKLVEAAERNGDARQGVSKFDQAINIPALRASFGIDALM